MSFIVDPGADVSPRGVVAASDFVASPKHASKPTGAPWHGFEAGVRVRARDVFAPQSSSGL